MQYINNILQEFRKAGLYPDFASFETSSTQPHVKVSGQDVLMFGSNNYLGLANDEYVVNRAIEIIKEHGVGPGGSRLLSGNLKFIEDFEDRLADFVGVEKTITFPTGYMANLAVFPAIMGPFIHTDAKELYIDGIIFSDQFNHATIIDGCRLTPAKKVVYKHNDLADLSKEIEKYSSIKHRMIVTESVYSTEGELTDVPEIVKIAKSTKSILMIDDAHGIGVLGNSGGGVKKEFGLVDSPDILMASFDKALGTTGGFLGGSKELIEYLRIASRPYIFSSALPAVNAAATWAVIDRITQEPEIINRAHSNAKKVRDALSENGFKIMGNKKTPAVPIYVGDDITGIKFQNMLFEEGIFAPCFRWPAAPAGHSRLRVSVMASHSNSDLDTFIEKTIKIGKNLKLI